MGKTRENTWFAALVVAVGGQLGAFLALALLGHTRPSLTAFFAGFLVSWGIVYILLLKNKGK